MPADDADACMREATWRERFGEVRWSSACNRPPASAFLCVARQLCEDTKHAYGATGGVHEEGRIAALALAGRA